MLTARLVASLRWRETLSENDMIDLWHLAAAVALGARYFVTSDRKLCRWIDSEYRGLIATLTREGFRRTPPLCIN